MFLEERQREITALIEKHGRVKVSDLAARFDVTEDCIRKDLKQLAAEGKCRKVYGGATRVEGSPHRSVGERIDLYQPEKQIIASKAIALIRPLQTIYLDVSSTSLCLARLVAEANLPCTVISPMIDIMVALARCPQVTAICPGGIMRADLNGFAGTLAVDAVTRFRFDIAFIGAYSVDIDSQEVATFEAEDGLLKHTAIERSGLSYLMCETRKLEAFGTYRFASLSDFDALICDDEDADAWSAVRAVGVDVL